MIYRSQQGVISKELSAEEYHPIARYMSSPPLHVAGTFVRVYSKGDLYHSCLAVVTKQDIAQEDVEVALLPRIGISGKRKRGAGASTRTGYFDEDIYTIFNPTASITRAHVEDFTNVPGGSIEIRINGVERFRHGLHIRSYASSKVVREDFPRRDEMEALCSDSYILSTMLPQIEKALKISWGFGTRIVVRGGPFKGQFGKTTALIDTVLSTVSVELQDPHVNTILSLNEASIYLEPGKNTRVLWGPRAGEIGMVVTDDDDEYVTLAFADNSMVCSLFSCFFDFFLSWC